MKFGLLFLVAMVAGCTTKANPASCADDHCNDPARPFCDEDGSIGGKPDTCISVECTAGAFGSCRGDNALMCNAAGTNFEEVECMYGCSDAAGGCNACNTAECEQHIIPRYLSNICNELSEREPASLGTQTLNTSIDENCSSIVPQSGAPEICVYRAKAISVPANNTLTLVGSRTMALVADRDVVVDGIINASGFTASDGPGGDFTRSGGTMGGGAGGAGFRHAGGAGGSTTADGGAANGGAAVPNPMASAVLVAGRSNGHNLIGGFWSGGGGGGLTIISCRGTVKVAGMIDANGGGGGAASEVPFSIPVTFNPPGGGGSGGYVVLQGMTVNVTGQVFANGGGGGSGQVGGNAGQNGLRSSAIALGGLAVSSSAGTGGNGGTGPTPPTAGAKPMTLALPNFPGAGGGSSGFLQAYVPSGGMLQLTPTMASPMLEGYLTLPTNR